MAGPLTGKVALISGGSRGIGAGIARLLARDGADVAIMYNSSGAPAEAVVEECKAFGGRSAAFKTNVEDPAQIDETVCSVANQFGGLDIVVHSAGIGMQGLIGEPGLELKEFLKGAPRADAKDVAARDAEWNRLWRINVFGFTAMMRSAAPLIRDDGSVIAIGSIGGWRVPPQGQADYAATKAALSTFCRGLARDLGGRRITANCIAAGPVDTQLNPNDGSEFAKMQIAETCVGRFGKPEDIGATAAFLAGPGARWITGTTLFVDGGVSA